jgi:cytochrome P450
VDIGALVEPARYGSDGIPYGLLAELRRDTPVRWCEPAGYPPFWAVTGHSEVRDISIAPGRFSSYGEIAFPFRSGRTEWYPADSVPRSVLGTDPPFHRELRNVALPYFKPRTLRALEDRVRELTRNLLDTVSGTRDLDFVTEVAAWHPLRMLCEILGTADEKMLLRLTNAFVGSADPEFVGSAERGEFSRWLYGLISDRRARGSRADLAGVLAHAPLDDEDILIYLLIIAIAGHDTTRSALAGGMHALVTQPGQLGRLRADPSLCESAANEIVRWTSPVVHFMRTAVEDCEVAGVRVRRGERLALFYPSANRDEAVFDEPDRFLVARDPNPHLGWGVGEHYCLGANLARMEIRVFLEEILPRLAEVRVTGEVEWMASNIICGVKHLPMRWTLH